MNNHQSLIEVAQELMSQKQKPQEFTKFAKEVCEILNVSEEDYYQKAADLYTDMTTSAIFVYCGEETFDLKCRQEISLYEKDSSHFKEGLSDTDEQLKELELRRQEDSYYDDEDEDSFGDLLDDEEDDETFDILGSEVVDDYSIETEDDEDDDEDVEYNTYEKTEFEDEFDEDEYDTVMDKYEDLYED